MAQVSTLSSQVEIKSSENAYFSFLKEKIPQLPQLFPALVQSLKFLEGNEIQDGVVFSINYVIGIPMTATLKLNVDESSNMIRLNVFEGDLMKAYNSFIVKVEVNNGCANGYIEFEKATETSPNPDSYVDVLSMVLKKLDTYLSAA